MKNLKSTLLILSVAITTIIGCKKTPTAGFSPSKTQAETDETITFTNTTEDGKTYSWDYGDGTTSTETSPSHAYTTIGTYAIKLTAYSKKEKKSSDASATITVVDARDKFVATYTGTRTYADPTTGGSESEPITEIVQKSIINSKEILIDEGVRATVNGANFTFVQTTYTDKKESYTITGGSGSLVGTNLTYTANVSYIDSTKEVTTFLMISNVNK